MAPSEETTSATCSQQPEQDVARAKLQQDSPKIQQGVSTNFEENIGHSGSPSCIGTIDPVLDGPKNVATNCTENIDPLVESQNSNASVCVKNVNPHVNSPKSGSNYSIGNSDSVVDKNVDHILDSSQSVENTDQIVDGPGICAAVTENGNGSESVVNTNKRHNDEIQDGPKKVVTNYAENDDKVVISAKCVTATNLDNVEQGAECSTSVSSVVNEKKSKVVDNPKCIAVASTEDNDEIMDRLKDKDSGDNTTCVENIACAVSVSKQEIGAKSENDGNHVTVAAKVDDIEIVKKGSGSGLDEAHEARDHGDDDDDDDDVREKCMLLLKELVLQADEVTEQRRDGVQQLEGGSLWCRLPFSKVSEALKFCKSSANSALANNKQSNTKQYPSCDNHCSATDESNLIQGPADDCRMKETGASSSVLLLYPSPPDSFAEESTPPSVFQGHKTMTIEPSLPGTPDDSSEDSPLGEGAVTLFTPSSTKVLGSPSIASVTPSSSDTVLDRLCMPAYAKAPCSSSLFQEGHKHDPAGPLVKAEQKPLCPSTTATLPAPQRFLFQLEPVHQIKMSDGQKLFACDICSSVYQRCFSLKRHYLRSHINHRYLTERDISNCGIVVSERLAKENPTVPSVEKRNVALGKDVDTVQESRESEIMANDIMNSSSDKCSKVNPVVENCVTFPNLYRCHLCSICFDTKDELKYHLSTHKPASLASKEKTASDPMNGNQQAHSKSRPDLKKGSKERDRLLSASSQELSSLVQVSLNYGQLMSDSVVGPSRQVGFSHISSVALPDQSMPATPSHSPKWVTSSLQKLTASHSSKFAVPGQSSKTSKSSKHVTSNRSSNHNISSHSFKPVSSVHLSIPSLSDHSSKLSSPGHLLKQPLVHHSSSFSSPEFISSAITKLTIPDQLVRPVMSSERHTTISHFPKPTLNERLLKYSSSSERGQHLCLYCDKSFSTLTMQKRHVARIHPHAQLSSQSKTSHHKCAYCTKPGGTFRELPHLVQHLLATHPDLYHACTTCELRFDCKDALDCHKIAVHHGDYRWNSVCTALPLPALSHSVTLDVSVAGKSSQSSPELCRGSKVKKSSAGGMDLLGSDGQFLYTCNVCREVFNDYVAKCRHHRQVHKGNRSQNLVARGVKSPTSGSDSKSQGHFVVLEKGSVDQIQDTNTEGCADEQEVKSDILCIKSVNSNICREPESDIKTDIELSSKSHSLKIKDPASETVREIHQANNLSENSEAEKPKILTVNVAKSMSEAVALAPFISVSSGEEMASSPRSPHLPPESTFLANSIEQVDDISSSGNKCISDSLEISDSVVCTGNKIGSCANSCDLTIQMAECRSDVSAGENDNFVQKSGSGFHVFGTAATKTTDDSVISKDYVSKSSLKSMFDDISDQSGDSVDISVTGTSMCLELGSEISLVDASDHVETISETKSVGCKLVVDSSLGYECSPEVGTPESLVDSSDPPVAGTLCHSTASLESLLAGTPASHGTNSTSLESECSSSGISDSLKACSDVLQSASPDSMDNNSLTKTKNYAVAPECVKESSTCDRTKISVVTEESCGTRLDINCTRKIPEISGHLVAKSRSSPGETFSDCTETDCKPAPDVTSNSLIEISGTALTKTSDFLETNPKSSLSKISDNIAPVIYDSKDPVNSPVGIILNSLEPSLDQSSNPKTAELPEGSSTLLLSHCSNLTEEISKHLLTNDLDALEENGKLSSNSTEECLKSAFADTLHSIEQTSNHSCMEEDISNLSPVEESSNPSKIRISNSMEVYSDQKFLDPRDTENCKLSLDVEDGVEGTCTPSLVETSSTVEESLGSLQVASGKPLIGTKRYEISLTKSIDFLDESLKTELTSDSMDENIQSPLIESLEDISQPLLTESLDSMVENTKSASTEGLDSMVENSKSASIEGLDSMMENSKSSSVKGLDSVKEQTSSTEIPDLSMENSESTERSNSMVENLKSVLMESSYMEENSKSVSIENLESMEESSESLDSVEEGSESVSLKGFDSVKESHKPASTESLDCLASDYKPAVTEGSEFMGENFKNAICENLEFLEENPQCLLPEKVCSMETGSKELLHESSDNIDLCSDAVPESLDAIKAELKPALSVAQSGCEPVSSRILRSNSTPLIKSFDPAEENDTIPLHERWLQSKTEAAANSQTAGSSRALRRSSALPVAKPVEPTADADDHPKGDSDRVLRSSAALKSDEPTVDQEVTCDMDSGPSKARSKSTMAATRRTRLRKFSRRVRGEQMQEERRMDPETLFYCRIAGNIRDNLLHHLDGKLEHEVSAMSQGPNKADLSQPHTSVTTTNEEKHNHHVHHKAPWEKFNFPKNYDGRCGEGAICLASYIKDMSHLDISTQLTMRQNLKRLSAASNTSRSSVDIPVEFSKDDVISFSRGLCLNAKVCADRRRSLRSATNRGRDALAAAPGGAASTFTGSVSLKRWSSADDMAAAGSVVELSGEWVRPRSYICAACGVMFDDLWDLEDHKYSQHPNVWCTHYEFEQAALEQVTDTSKSLGGGISSKNLSRRFLLVREAAETIPLPVLNSEVKCTKCERGFSTLPDLHRHILECGGDTTWMLLPSPSSSGRRARKWRPFGSRRRRQQGSHRRGMKRNIPTTPVKQYFRARHRSIAGDTIQRMLANLPAKRSTRRAIQFSEDEIKTRSQGTIHSNRLLRKRYKVSFATAMLRTSHKTGHKVVHSLQVRTLTTDSSDSAPKKFTVRAPKKLPPAPSVISTVTSDQTPLPKRQLIMKKLPRSKSQPVNSVPHSKSTDSEVQRKANRGGRSLSPVANKSETFLLSGSEETKQPSVHKSRGRSKKKPVLSPSGDGLTEPSNESSKKIAGPDISMQEFDVDISTVGSTETSNILAAMRIAMLEGVITETPPLGASPKKLIKRFSVKKDSCVEENKITLQGKRKKLPSNQQNSVKKKTKLSQSELEERFLRNKGYTHPDEITDEPIICKGCGLQFDNGSAELRHRKTCIYVPPEEDVGSIEVQDLHPCLHCYVQFPSVSTQLKHMQQCKAAVKSNTEVTDEPFTGFKKTATAKAKSKKRDNCCNTTAAGKEDVVEPQKSIRSCSENSVKIGRTKAKPGSTKTKQEITKRKTVIDGRIIKGKKVDLTDSVDNSLDATKKWPTSTKNTSNSVTKKKVDNMETVNISSVEMPKKIGRESTNSSSVRTKKKPDILKNAHSSLLERKKKLDDKENASSGLLGTKQKLCSTENVSSSTVGTKKKVDKMENVKSGPGRTKKKKNGTEICSGDSVRTKNKPDIHNRPVTTKRKLDSVENASPVITEKMVDRPENASSSLLESKKKLGELEDASSSSAGIVEGICSASIGAKNIKNSGNGPVVSKKKQGNMRRTVSSSPMGARKKLGRTRNHSPGGTKRKHESSENMSNIPAEVEKILPVTQNDSSSPVVWQECLDHTASESPKKQVECGTEIVNNNSAKKKKRSGSAGSAIRSHFRKRSRLDNTRSPDIVLTGAKKKFDNIDILNVTKSKSGSSESVSNNTDERKHKCSSTGNETGSPAASDVDDRMPELQKEEPIEDLKTETPSPKVEDLCDIPILSPVGCELLAEDCEEKNSDTDLSEMLRKDVMKEKEEQRLPVQGKKHPKTTSKKNNGLKHVRTTMKIRKPSDLVKIMDVRFQIPQIPLQIQPSELETSVGTPLTVGEACDVIPLGEDNDDNKPLAECVSALVTSSERYTTMENPLQKVKKAAPSSKQQKRKPVRRRNSTILWNKKGIKGATKTKPQLTEEDSSDDLLPISKLKEVIQKKAFPLEELNSNGTGACDTNSLVEQMNSRVTEGLESESLVEVNPPTVSRPDEASDSESLVQHNTKKSHKIPVHVSLNEKSLAVPRRGTAKTGKRGRTQSWGEGTKRVSDQFQPQARRKASLPCSHLEIPAAEGVLTGIQQDVKKAVIPKRKARKYTEQVESQDSTQVEDLISLSNQGERNGLSIKRQEMESERQVITKRKRKIQVEEMQFEDGDSVYCPVSHLQDSTLRHEDEEDHLVSTEHKTDISEACKEEISPSLLCEEASDAGDEELFVAKRKLERQLKEFGTQSMMAAFPVSQMCDTVPYVLEGKKTNYLLNEGHKTILNVDEKYRKVKGKRNSLIGKKLGITKTKAKGQLKKIRSQYRDDTGQAHWAEQKGETDYLIAEEVGSEGTNSVKGELLSVANRKSKQQLEEYKSKDGEVSDSNMYARQDSGSVVGRMEKVTMTGDGDLQDVHDFICEKQETERPPRESGEESIPSCREVTSMSICEEIKIRRRRKEANLADKTRKTSHLINDKKETCIKEKKKANFQTNEEKETKQKIKLVIGKRRRKKSPTLDEQEQMCRLISEEEEKRIANTDSEETVMHIQDKETGDNVETHEISRKDELNGRVIEEEDRSADTGNRIDLNHEIEDANAMPCVVEETTNTSVDETGDTSNHLNAETEDLRTLVCFKGDSKYLLGERKLCTLIGEKEASQPTVESDKGLIIQVERMDTVDSVEMNVDNEESGATLTSEQEAFNSDILGADSVSGDKDIPVRNILADSLVHQEGCLNAVIIDESLRNDGTEQVGSLSSTINIVSSTDVEDSQMNVEIPLRQARRTRCNTSYEELYTWSDVTSETEEDSSQDLPNSNIMATLCQDADISTYEEIAAMIANGEYLFPSNSKKKKKKKLRNNSRQYRNGHIRRNGRKKQKLRPKLMKKTRRSAVHEFVVTDIETGQEESQDSCESIVLSEIMKAEHPPMGTDTRPKHADVSMKKRARTLQLPESKEQAVNNENAQVCDSDRPKQKRKSSVGSMFFCTLCNKHYSTNYNLMKHKLSLLHKRLSERDQPSTPVDMQKTECKQWHSSILQNTESKQTSTPVEAKLPDSVVIQDTETELSTSDSQNAEPQPSSSVNHSVGTEQQSGSVNHVEVEEVSSSVQNTESEKSCSSVMQDVVTEPSCSAIVQDLEAEHILVSQKMEVGKSSVVLSENTEFEEMCSVVRNVGSEETCAVDSERTYTLMQNMDIEQFSTNLPDKEVDRSVTYVEKPSAAERNSERVLGRSSSVQNSPLDTVQQGTNLVETSSGTETRNEIAAALSNSAAGMLCGEQVAVWTEHQADVTSDWLGKERDIQHNSTAASWPASVEQKQASWLEGQVDNNQWLYASQWSQEMAWGREANPDMHWNADSSQDDTTFFQSNSASLGSILDSVNQILDNERSADRLPAADGYQPYVDLLQSGTEDVVAAGGLRELQQAMGATDEEMAMLQQLGEGSWPVEDADIMDLDNQKSDSTTLTGAPTSATSTSTNTPASRLAKLVEGTAGNRTRSEEEGGGASSVAMAQSAVTTRALSRRGGLRTQDMQLALYENKDMVCPVCSRRFLGLNALKAHLAAAHNSSTRHRTQAVIKRPRIVPSSASDGSGEPARHVCIVCKELLPDEQGLADHVEVAHVERQNTGGKRVDGMGGSKHSTAGGGDEGLRSHMTSALGGLLTRALNNFLGKNRSQPSPPATQVPSPITGSLGGSHSSMLLTQPVAQLLGHGLKVTNRRHSSGPVDEQLFSCIDCDERFTSKSNRNRHVARAHRGQQYHRLSTDSPLELTRTASPLTSHESIVSEIDTDNLPLSIRISNFSSETRPTDGEPGKSQLIAANSVNSETSPKTKKDHSSQMGEGCSATILQEIDHMVGTPCNSVGEEEQDREKLTVKRSTCLGKRQDREQFEYSKTHWRSSLKADVFRPRSENSGSVSDEDSIKAKAVAALRALNARDRRIRNGLPGSIGAALWSGVSRKKSRGLNSDDRFRFPLVRKTPPSINRFASLAEKKKKNVSRMVKLEAMSWSKENPEEGRKELQTMPASAASPVSYDVYEFQDEVEQAQHPSELGLAEFRLRTPVGKIASQDNGADTGPISDVEESKVAEWESLQRDPTRKAVDPQPFSEQKEERCTHDIQNVLENTKKKVLKSLKLSEQNPRLKHNHISRKHESSKKRRWHRIIVVSGEDTSDTETGVEPHDIRSVALDQKLDNHKDREKSLNLEHRSEEGRGSKRRHMMPCLSGVLVEDRQRGKRSKKAKPPRNGSKRSTKTELLMSVFAKSRQRNNSVNNTVAATHSVPAKTPFCSASLSEPYRSVGPFGSIAGAESESDSGSLATSVSAGNLAISSDDERIARQTKSQPRNQKKSKQKPTAL